MFIVSIIAIGFPTLTISPSLTKILDNFPEYVDGISVSTLSVAISTTESSFEILSPSFFSHLRIVHSITLSPILGIIISILLISFELN